MTNSNTKKLSVLIITLNEEEHLKDCYQIWILRMK